MDAYRQQKMELAEPDVMSHLLTVDCFFDYPIKDNQLLVDESRELNVAGCPDDIMTVARC
jgi:hypothetical protein